MLNVNSILLCPHGGVVRIISSNLKVKVDGAPAALVTDQFLISGCPFQIPIGVGTKPSPCVSVKWVTNDLRTKVAGIPSLSRTSVGICVTVEQIPQGAVIIVFAQPRVKTQ